MTIATAATGLSSYIPDLARALESLALRPEELKVLEHLRIEGSWAEVRAIARGRKAERGIH